MIDSTSFNKHFVKHTLTANFYFVDLSITKVEIVAMQSIIQLYLLLERIKFCLNFCVLILCILT